MSASWIDLGPAIVALGLAAPPEPGAFRPEKTPPAPLQPAMESAARAQTMAARRTTLFMIPPKRSKVSSRRTARGSPDANHLILRLTGRSTRQRTRHGCPDVAPCGRAFTGDQRHSLVR